MKPIGKRALLVALSFLPLFAGCAAKAPVETEWVALEDGAEDLAAARRACKSRALEETKNLRPQNMAARAAGGIFMECMREKGWELRQKISRQE